MSLSTDQALLYVVFPALLLLVVLASYAVVRYFSEEHSLSWVPIVGLVFTFLTFAVVPLDVMNVAAIGGVSTHFTILLYNASYMISFLLVTIFLPFAFWYLRGPQGDGDPGEYRAQRSQYAALRTLPGALLATGVVVLGVMLQGKEPTPTTPYEQVWYDQVYHHSSDLSKVIRFIVAAIGLIGIVPFTVYTAYGLTYLPIACLWGAVTDYEVRLTIRGMSRALEVVTGLLQGSDDYKRQGLRNKQRVLSSKVQRLSMAPGASGEIHSPLHDIVLRLVGVVLMFISLFLVGAVAISRLDMVLHSSCGSDCAYLVKESPWPNPFDDLLMDSTMHSPADVVLLVMYLGYIAAAGWAGVSMLSPLRLCRVRRRATSPQALVVVLALLICTVTAFSIQLVYVAPRFFSFGGQTILGTNVPCSLVTLNVHTDCRLTELVRIVHGVTLEYPILGMVNFHAAWLFIVVFLLSFVNRLTSWRPTGFAEYDSGGEVADDVIHFGRDK
jgi:hypothetical protein